MFDKWKARQELCKVYKMYDKKAYSVLFSNSYNDIHEEYNTTMIFVTHDLNEAISMADYVVVLSKGPSIVKNMYKIDLECKGSPSTRRKDSKFNYYFDLIYGELDNIV
jgi:NitT/TauT family transport system ATP-binding protein